MTQILQHAEKNHITPGDKLPAAIMKLQNTSLAFLSRNQNFRDITWNVEEKKIIHEILRVVSRFPGYISCYKAENRLPLGQCRAVLNWFIFCPFFDEKSSFIVALHQPMLSPASASLCCELSICDICQRGVKCETTHLIFMENYQLYPLRWSIF